MLWQAQHDVLIVFRILSFNILPQHYANKLLLLPLLLGLSSCLNLLKPVHRFSAASAGPAPRYADSAAWLVLPGHPSAASQRPPGLAAAAPDTVADVFFIHPTTYFWRLGYWNAPLRLRRLRRYTNRTTIRNQASLFAPVGRLYAPIYR